MEFIDLQCSEDLKSKFLTCHILNFCKNHMLLSIAYSDLITHTQQIVSMFDFKYCCEQFSKIKHSKTTLHSQLSNHPWIDMLLQSTSSFNLVITSFYICKKTSDISLKTHDCYLVNLAGFFFSPLKIIALDSLELSFVALRAENVCNLFLISWKIYYSSNFKIQWKL